ncbi:MAG TPA: 4'-phosphopantetheinyl transferase superfamily protein [Pseudonocardiaceae bacterium]|nr:4'-phosphopantetheinyl transferase superfamily protein [Pseudonocardiaceae bacterium]
MMLAELLPDDVAVADTVGDEDPAAYLLPAEEHLVEKSVLKRRREVTNARTCARRALAALGRPEVAILRGAKGEPLWPAGVVGSITHTSGYYAAAVAEASRLRSVGVDAEVHGPLPDGVLSHVAFGAELVSLAGLRADDDHVWWERLLFSAKESVYKSWFPLTGRWLGFEDAEVIVAPDGTFRARILIDGTAVDGGPPLAAMAGRWLVRDGLVLTAITLPLA